MTFKTKIKIVIASASLMLIAFLISYLTEPMGPNRFSGKYWNNDVTLARLINEELSDEVFYSTSEYDFPSESCDTKLDSLVTGESYNPRSCYYAFYTTIGSRLSCESKFCSQVFVSSKTWQNSTIQQAILSTFGNVCPIANARALLPVPDGSTEAGYRGASRAERWLLLCSSENQSQPNKSDEYVERHLFVVDLPKGANPQEFANFEPFVVEEIKHKWKIGYSNTTYNK